MNKLQRVKKAIVYKLDSIKANFGINSPKLTENKSQWKDVAQEFEFNFHKTNKFRQSDEFVKESKLLFESFGFTEKEFEHRMVADLGAGSRMRGKFFNHARLVVIEPMANRCMQEISWCDFKDAEMVFSKPAEEMIPELEGKVDFLFSVNVLDHCYDFEQIIRNIYRYIHVDGLVFLSFDSHFKTSVGHPLVLTDRICDRIFKSNGFKIVKFSKGFSKKYKDEYPKNGYDNSSYCLNYWLKK